MSSRRNRTLSTSSSLPTTASTLPSTTTISSSILPSTTVSSLPPPTSSVPSITLENLPSPESSYSSLPSQRNLMSETPIQIGRQTPINEVRRSVGLSAPPTIATMNSSPIVSSTPISTMIQPSNPSEFYLEGSNINSSLQPVSYVESTVYSYPKIPVTPVSTVSFRRTSPIPPRTTPRTSPQIVSETIKFPSVPTSPIPSVIQSPIFPSVPTSPIPSVIQSPVFPSVPTSPIPSFQSVVTSPVITTFPVSPVSPISASSVPLTSTVPMEMRPEKLVIPILSDIKLGVYGMDQELEYFGLIFDPNLDFMSRVLGFSETDIRTTWKEFLSYLETSFGFPATSWKYDNSTSTWSDGNNKIWSYYDSYDLNRTTIFSNKSPELWTPVSGGFLLQIGPLGMNIEFSNRKEYWDPESVIFFSYLRLQNPQFGNLDFLLVSEEPYKFTDDLSTIRLKAKNSAFSNWGYLRGINQISDSQLSRRYILEFSS